MTVNTPSPSNSEDEIDLKDLIIPIWKARKQILTIATICGILGGIVGFLTPATYTASSTFLPQTAQSVGAGSLGGLAALAGINLSTGAGAGGDILPSMYATVSTSEPFRKRILDAKIVVNGDSLTYRTYLETQPSSVLGTLKEYTIGLPGKLIGALYSSEDPKEERLEKGLQPLTDAEFALQESLGKRISIEIDENVGFVVLTAFDGDPMAAAQVVKITEEVLQDWIIKHKINNAKAQYDFIAKQFESKQKEFFSIQDQLAGYMDRNQNVLSATYRTRLERLQAEFNLVNTVYSELAKQKELAAIQLSKDTPTFSVLDPVKVPKKKTGPKKSIYALITFFVGIIFSAGWFLASKPVIEFFKDLQQTTT
jgi:hypothetical protein